MSYLYTYLIGAFLIATIVPAIAKVFFDKSCKDVVNDNELGLYIFLLIGWPVTLTIVVVGGTIHGSYKLAVKIFTNLKTSYEEYQKTKYDDLIP